MDRFQPMSSKEEMDREYPNCNCCEETFHHTQLDDNGECKDCRKGITK